VASPEPAPSHHKSSAARFYDAPYVLLSLSSLFWAGNFVLARAVHLDVPPIGLAFWRWAGAFVFLLPFCWRHMRRDWAVFAANWRVVAAMSFFGVAAFNSMVYVGMHDTTAVNGLIIQSAYPASVVIVTYLMYRDRITPLQGLGIVVSFSGALAVISKGDFGILASFAFNRGDLWIGSALFIYAAYSALLRERPRMHAVSFLGYTFLIGVVMLAPLYAWEHASGTVMAVNRVTALSVLYVAVFPSILAYFFYNRGVELAGANRAGMFIHLMPVFGSVLAVVFLDERLYPFHGFGLALILTGIYLAVKR